MRKALAQIVGITPDGIKWNLDKLKASNKIRRIGADHGGHWEVLDKTEE